MFHANEEVFAFISTLVSARLSPIVSRTVVGQTPLPARTSTHDSDKHTKIFKKAHQPLPFFVLPFLIRHEPELQRCVSVLTPLAVDKGLIVVVAPQGLQQQRL